MPTKHGHARQSYLEWYSHLSSVPEVNDSGRAPGEQALESLQHRLDGLNLASEELLQATQPALISENHHIRAAGIESLLHQVEGDLRASQLMWEIVEAAGSLAEDQIYTAITRILKAPQLHLRRLSYFIPNDLTETAAIYRGEESNPHLSPSLMLQESLNELRGEIDDTTTIIFRYVNRVGLQLTRGMKRHDSEDTDAIRRGIELLRGSQAVGSIGWGLEDEVVAPAAGLAGEIRGTLVNIIARILLIIEKNDLVRYTIADWVDDLGSVSLSEQRAKLHTLIEHLYQMETFKKNHLESWLVAADNPHTVAVATHEIHLLADNFQRLASQILRIGNLAGQCTLFEQPLLASTGYALRVGLLGILIFAGFDHMDEGTHALNITRGIKEILISEFHIPRELLHRLRR